MTRAYFMPTLVAAACAAGAAFAADWTVSPKGGVCETQARLSGAASGLSLIVRSTGETTRIAAPAPAGAVPERVSLSIDGRRQPLAFRATDGQVEADLSPAVINAIARGGQLSVRGLGPQPLSASLRGSGRAMGALQACGDQVRVAALSQQQQDQARAEAAAAEKARVDAEIRTKADDEAALAQAKKAADDNLVRQSREVLPGLNLK